MAPFLGVYGSQISGHRGDFSITYLAEIIGPIVPQPIFNVCLDNGPGKPKLFCRLTHERHKRKPVRNWALYLLQLVMLFAQLNIPFLPAVFFTDDLL